MNTVNEIMGLVDNHYADYNDNYYAALRTAIEELEVANTILKNERDTAVGMLAGWCVAVRDNGGGWDYWDEYYKDAAYRDGPIRYLIDAAMKGST